MKKVIVLSGRSGVGKDTIISKLDMFERFPSYTTRPIRTGEINGIDYHFISEKEFEKAKAKGELLDAVNIAGYLYGFPINDFLQRESGLFALNMIPESGLLIKRLIPATNLIYLEFPNRQEQINRLKLRGASDYEIGVRIKYDPNDWQKPRYYDCSFVNYDSNETAQKILTKIWRIK